jgi:hypothetical protein
MTALLIEIEECASLSAAALFKKHPPLMAILESVVKEPCKYLPTDVEIRKTLQSDLAGKIAHTNYIKKRKYIGCDKTPKFFKTIISFREYSSEQPILMYSGK